MPLLDRKRLELARSLATAPRLLLLDEIAGGLTEHEVQALIETINDVRRSGVAIIWIEHVVHALVAVVDRIIAINFGSLLADGRPAEVMADPRVRRGLYGIGRRMSLLEVTGLQAFYGDFQALFGIDFRAEEGHAVAVIGANGAGKSTFLRALAGFNSAEPDAIRFDGAPLGGVAPSAVVGKGVALVPEGRRLFPSLSVEENLEIGAYSGAQRAVDAQTGL